jgi:hypothetical protein
MEAFAQIFLRAEVSDRDKTFHEDMMTSSQIDKWWEKESNGQFFGFFSLWGVFDKRVMAVSRDVDLTT